MTWKTYLILHFGTKGTSMTNVLEKVESLGFETTFGPVDFIYEWPTKPSKEDIAQIGDMLIEKLKDTGCVFNLDTHE
ncbi:MAG: hypothetical protein KC506_00785 [Nanoarchaeota archaeon]|nr:hypothetical protein [Nanoarchaeota archaeon]